MYQVAKAAIPVANWLESWGDIMPETGAYSLMQPTIQKIYKSRQIEESLLVWTNGKIILLITIMLILKLMLLLFRRDIFQ